MYRATVVLAVGLAVAGWAAPEASATVAPPEQPDTDGVAFTDNASILDPHPLPVESWSRVGDDRAIAVHFTSGTPACNGVSATAREMADAVTVSLTGGSLPTSAGRMCIMLAVVGTLVVPLKSPLGDRQVLSAS
jgi:hypothetical protein